MANPEHVEKLKEGVEAWNKWRADNPSIVPDLANLDFTKPEWKATPIWNNDQSRMQFYVPNGESRPIGINLQNATLTQCVLDNCDLWMADLTDSRMWQSSCVNASFLHVNFTRAILTRGNFTNASFRGGFLTNAIMAGVKIHGANFHNCRVDGAYLGSALYSRSKLTDKCRGIGGAETIYGNAALRRDLLDQDFIDTKRKQWRSPAWNPARIYALWPWVLFGYGRSWLRVAIFALGLISIFGLGYSVSNGLHIQFTHIGPTVKGAFYPWFVASMGFATLGISDMVEPLDGWGQALIIGNVLAGFVTLGLLLSVLGNSFARRA